MGLFVYTRYNAKTIRLVGGMSNKKYCVSFNILIPGRLNDVQYLNLSCCFLTDNILVKPDSFCIFVPMINFLKTSLFLFLSFLLVQCGTKKDEKKQEYKQPKTSTDQSLADLNKKLVDDPNNAGLYHERCLYFFNKGKYEKAMDDITRALSIDSANTEYIYTKGDIYFTVMRFDDATAAFAKVLKKEHGHARANLKMARILMQLKQYKEAIQHIDLALKTDVNLAEGYFLKGVAFQYMGDSVNAASSYQTAVEQKADYYDAYVTLGLLYAARRDSLAVEYYTSALSLRPNSPEALYNLAIYYQDNGKPKKAFAIYNELNKLGPNEGAFHNKGYIYLVYLGQYDKAIPEFDSALHINTKYVEAYHNRGLAYRELKKYREARADFKAALKLNPQFELSANELDDMDRKHQ
jgi:tetratricopeptide (TPR) repeat protein